MATVVFKVKLKGQIHMLTGKTYSHRPIDMDFNEATSELITMNVTRDLHSASRANKPTKF
jgi:hypothetical protein